MVVERTKVWTKERDDYLRKNYDAKRMRVDPAILAMNLHVHVARVINRMAELGLRRKVPRESE